MHEELYQYFIQHKQLNVPGIGTFLLERKPATTDFPNKQIHPPAYSISLQQTNVSPSKSFFTWVAEAFNITEREAVIRFNDFIYGIKRQIAEGSKINWAGIGIISSGLGGEVRFDPAFKEKMFESPVKAEKVIRENASHYVRVGEDEKTSVEMTELLSRTETSKNYWWLAALILLVLSFLFIGWYLSVNGINTSSSGLKKGIEAPLVTETYKTLP